MIRKIFESIQLGSLTLSNRMVMAPMTRNRATKEGLVSKMMVTHYQQRASAGLIIAESTPVSNQGVGYPNTPGLFTEEQADSWKSLISAVHTEGGYIFAQLQHCGRISHSSYQPDNTLPVAPSAIKPDGQAVTYSGMLDFETPHILDTQEILHIVEQFRRGAEMAKRAGFDGIEIHGANGYIIDQFLRDGCNQRSDEYGGNLENRMRLLNQILDAVCAVWAVGQVGVRLTPENSFNSMSDSNPQLHFEYYVEQLNTRNLAYVHILEGDMMTKTSTVDYRAIRAKFSGVYIANNGYDLIKAKTAIEKGDASLVAFGVPFLANPDLVYRYRENLSLNEADPATFYGGDEVGYTDYPIYNNS
ncbi:Fmn oxidoreductase protein [hydrothermal vent metagenome]|uniref:Fmn oxidoreductase protein n=1 Tax=hydrothermal vent metagenome TaxID=652676 RepID=A0A3B0XZE5_9ZZZZ